jgi:glycosyltransferase involved in cell wall biosynthesis
VRVLLQTGLDLSRPGGVETHVRELATALEARGHEVVVEARAGSRPYTAVSDLDPARFDVLHQHGERWPRGLPLDYRYVRTLHFCVAAKMETYVRLGRLRTLVNPGNLRAVREDAAMRRRPGRCIAVSERVRADYARWHHLDPARVTVIPNGASFDPPRGDAAEWRARHGVPAGAPVLLTIGRADFVKGYDLLERAWRRVRVERPEALWVIAGGARAKRAEGRLATGPIARADVMDWIHAADLGALPSYYEGCSLSLLDMLAAGRYTLAHDVGNARQVIRPGVNGELVERNADAWASTLSRVLAARPGRVTDGLPRSFGWDAIAGRVEVLYREIVEARGGEG